MKKSGLIVIVLAVVFAGAVEVQADTLVTVDTLRSWTREPYSLVTSYATYGNFTFNGSPATNIYAVIYTETAPGVLELNGYGHPSTSNPGTFFFDLFGTSEQLYDINPIYGIDFIEDNGDGELFTFNNSTGVLSAMPGDSIWDESYVSINGKEFGDISDIIYDVWGGRILLDSVVIDTTIPEPATMSLLALGGLAMLRRRRK